MVRKLSTTQCPEVQQWLLREGYKNFAQLLTLERFEAVVSPPGEAVSFRQTALALGLLLQPVLTQGHAELSKGLMLPLPRDPMQLPHVLTLWVDLVIIAIRLHTYWNSKRIAAEMMRREIYKVSPDLLCEASPLEL